MSIEKINRSTVNLTAFTACIDNIAATSEALSEQIRDTADVLATLDPAMAIALYQGADQINQTAQSFRQISLPPARIELDLSWAILSFFCGLCVGLL